jgi:SAM-dependent methyltransferase
MADGAEQFYGVDQAAIHDRAFGDLARGASGLLVSQLRSHGLRSGTVVDLGCGSGILLRVVCDSGFDGTGVDISPAMVDLARRAAPRASIEQGSLHEAALPAAVGVTAIGEALNYATDPSAGLDALVALSSRVHDALAPGGLFLFDVATPGRIGPAGEREVWHDHGDWANMHARESDDHATLDRNITIFTRMRGDTYRRTDERHVLRLFKPEDVVDVLQAAGFDVEVRDHYDAASSPSTPASGWIVAVATRR